MSDYTDRLVEAWARVPDDLRETGRDWYSETRRYARRIGEGHGRTVRTAAGMLSALSPQVPWQVARVACETMMDYGESLARVLPLSETRALYIWAGMKPLSVLRGPKTIAFYRAILGDTDQCVIDTIMLVTMGWEKAYYPTKRQYERLGRALTEAARLVGEPTTVFQATVWCGQRGGGD